MEMSHSMLQCEGEWEDLQRVPAQQATELMKIGMVYQPQDT